MIEPVHLNMLVDQYCGNVMAVLPQLGANSVQTVVTSPPYWLLRRYDGSQECVWDTVKCAFGLEATVSEYVQHTVQILEEIKKVLRADGICWWNIGDSYYRSGQGYGDTKTTNKNYRGSRERQKPIWSNELKSKDLCLIPFRVALAAQDAGWWVRSIVIWHKKNNMPESVKDRPTQAHDYILMLTKSPKYYFNAEAVKEPAQDWGTRDRSNFRGGTTDPLLQHHGFTNCNHAETGRNIRSVWEMNTKPFPTQFIGNEKIDHFATFPPELPRRCILASTRPGDLVLDPFAGSGTTGMVAVELNRKAILIDVSEKYCRMQRRRIQSAVWPTEPMELERD